MPSRMHQNIPEYARLRNIRMHRMHIMAFSQRSRLHSQNASWNVSRNASRNASDCARLHITRMPRLSHSQVAPLILLILYIDHAKQKTRTQKYNTRTQRDTCKHRLDTHNYNVNSYSSFSKGTSSGNSSKPFSDVLSGGTKSP